MHPWAAMRRSWLQETHRQQWEWMSWTLQRWEVQMEVVGVAEAHEMPAVPAVVVEEVGWALIMPAVMEALTAEVVEVEARDLLEG